MEAGVPALGGLEDAGVACSVARSTRISGAPVVHQEAQQYLRLIGVRRHTPVPLGFLQSLPE